MFFPFLYTMVRERLKNAFPLTVRALEGSKIGYGYESTSGEECCVFSFHVLVLGG